MRAFFFSLVLTFAVFGLSVALQWPLGHGGVGFAGTGFACAVAFGASMQWRIALRNEKRELLERFVQINNCSDRIRNALQVIQHMVYLTPMEGKEPIYKAVDTIDAALREAHREVGLPLPHKKVAAAGVQ